MTGHPMTAICLVLGIARRTAYDVARGRPPGRYHRASDVTVLAQIRAVTNSRATYGYRRAMGVGKPDVPGRLQSQAHSARDATPRAHAGPTSPSPTWPSASGAGATAGVEPALVLRRVPHPVLEWRGPLRGLRDRLPRSRGAGLGGF